MHLQAGDYYILRVMSYLWISLFQVVLLSLGLQDPIYSPLSPYQISASFSTPPFLVSEDLLDFETADGLQGRQRHMKSQNSYNWPFQCQQWTMMMMDKTKDNVKSIMWENDADKVLKRVLEDNYLTSCAMYGKNIHTRCWLQRCVY